MSRASLLIGQVYAESGRGDFPGLADPALPQRVHLDILRPGESGMHIVVTGGTGFIGSALVPALQADGHRVTVLTRGATADDEACRRINRLSELAPEDPVDAIVNLAGASLAGGRWSEAYKQEIISSRLDTTAEVVALCQRQERPPAALISASAIGYYGHHGNEVLAEDGEAVPGFAHGLCQRWESVACRAREAGTRVCLARLGVVLDRGGGALEQMARPFRFGVANWLGSGDQWLSWVHRRDVVAAIQFLLAQEALSGPFNLTAPEPVTSREFCEVMKTRKRTLITAPVPAAVLRLLVGEMAEELLLNGQRVVPAKLRAAGFEFAFPELSGALADLL